MNATQNPRGITAELIAPIVVELESHPVYNAVATLADLRCFMQHHVYSVWDFMSLIKTLQAVVAPTTAPWVPRGDGSVRRFINELVLEEESDATGLPDEHLSHFELYLRAMREIGADTGPMEKFVSTVEREGIESALSLPTVPAPSRAFTATTFDFIASGRPHVVAAALALGREHIIPAIFRAILRRIGISEQEAPTFHFYLNRHVHLDEDFHAPLSLRLLNGLCEEDFVRIEEAIESAHHAVAARMRFWDGVHVALGRLSGG